jgi:hypothetical protein
MRKIPVKILMVMLGAAFVLATPVSAPAYDGPQFGCDARAPTVCRFRIYYAQQHGNRVVVLPAGMKVYVTDATPNRDTYCVAANADPAPKCIQRVIKSTYNN